MSDLGLIHYFLGIEVYQEKEGIFILQKKYKEDVLSKFKMLACKTVATQLVPSEKLKRKTELRKQMLEFTRV